MSEGTTTRRRLAEMEANELREWLTLRRKQLLDHTTYVQEYLDRRAKAGKRTHTDRRSQQFQLLAADLLSFDSINPPKGGDIVKRRRGR